MPPCGRPQAALPRPSCCRGACLARLGAPSVQRVQYFHFSVTDKQERSLSITVTLVRGAGGIGRSPFNVMKPNGNLKHSGAHGRFGSEVGVCVGKLTHPSLQVDALKVDGL